VQGEDFGHLAAGPDDIPLALSKDDVGFPGERPPL
ncbi:hypothetical protein T265_12011, partial [Opisthorchis viverrini]